MGRFFFLKRDVMKANLRSRWWSSLSLSKSCCFALHNSNCCERPCRRGMSPTRWAWQATKSFLAMTHDCQEQDGGDGGHLDRSHLELLQLLLAETRLLHDLVHALLWSRWLENHQMHDQWSSTDVITIITTGSWNQFARRLFERKRGKGNLAKWQYFTKLANPLCCPRKKSRGTFCSWSSLPHTLCIHIL